MNEALAFTNDFMAQAIRAYLYDRAYWESAIVPQSGGHTEAARLNKVLRD